MQRIILQLALFIAVSTIEVTSSSSSKCGLAPSEITLKRGERQSLVFWSDQKYEHVEHEHEHILVETTTKDYFLEAVNGGIDDQDAANVEEENTNPQVENDENNTEITTIEQQETTINDDTTQVPTTATEEKEEEEDQTEDQIITTTTIPIVEEFEFTTTKHEQVNEVPEAQVDQQIALEEETEVTTTSTITTTQNEDVDLLVDHEQNVIELTEVMVSETETTTMSEINDADHETSDDFQTNGDSNLDNVVEEEILETTTIILSENNDTNDQGIITDVVEENFDEIFEADIGGVTTQDNTEVEITTIQTNDELLSENPIQVLVSTEEEEENEEITTNTAIIFQDIDDEILDDDTDDAFEEDFGVDVQLDADAELIFDPLDDIADGQEEQKFPVNDIEYVEVPDHPEIASETSASIGETSQASVQPYLFDHTTIAYPIEDIESAKPVFEFEAVVAEEESSDLLSRPENNNAGHATSNNNHNPTDSAGLLLETTTGTPEDNNKPSSSSSFKPIFEAVVAEEEESNQSPRPGNGNGVTDDQGLFIETTTGSNNIKPASIKKSLNKVQTVSEVLEKERFSQGLEKQARAKDEDIIDTSNLQSLAIGTESPADLVINITDPSEKPGSILTTLIDGFLLPKVPQQVEETEKTDPTNNNNIAIKESEQEITEGGFPVTNILSGIYSLVSELVTNKENTEDIEPVTAIPEDAINVHNMPRDHLIVQAALAEDEDVLPSEPLPLEFHRGAPTDNKPRPQNIAGPVLLLNDAQAGTREPVNIPLPNLISPRSLHFDPVESIRLKQLIKEQFLSTREKREIEDDEAMEEEEDHEEQEEITTEQSSKNSQLDCSWHIKTEPGLYLLATFHNLSAPYTVECEGAYIEVERENNGFEARWCGNRVTTGGSRPHVIFAKNEVRITVFDDGTLNKELPTGFSADIEVIDLLDGQQYSEDLKTGYSKVKKLTGRTFF